MLETGEFGRTRPSPPSSTTSPRIDNTGELLKPCAGIGPPDSIHSRKAHRHSSARSAGGPRHHRHDRRYHLRAIVSRFPPITVRSHVPPLTPPDGAPRAPRMTKPGTGGDERVSPPSRSPPTVNRYRHISSRPLASKRTVLVYLDEARPRTVAKALWGMGCGAGTAAMFAVKREGRAREGAGTGESARRLPLRVGEVIDQIVPNMVVRKQPLVPELKGGGPCADAVLVQQRREYIMARR